MPNTNRAPITAGYDSPLEQTCRWHWYDLNKIDMDYCSREEMIDLPKEQIRQTFQGDTFS